MFHSPVPAETSALTFAHPPFHHQSLPPPVEADTSRTHQPDPGLGAGLPDPSTDIPNPTPPTAPQGSDTETLDPHLALSSPSHPPSPVAESLAKSNPSQGSPPPNTEAASHHLGDRF